LLMFISHIFDSRTSRFCIVEAVSDLPHGWPQVLIGKTPPP
jgi:hypothetical protein